MSETITEISSIYRDKITANEFLRSCHSRELKIEFINLIYNKGQGLTVVKTVMNLQIIFKTGNF